MANKNFLTGAIGLALLGGAAYLLWKEHNKADAPPPSASSGDKQTVINKPEPKTDSLGKPIPKAPVAPAPKVVSADSVLEADPKMILGKPLIAKFNGAGIYDTILKKVGVTVQGKTLGKCFKTEKTSSGSYQLKYQDENGNFRIINSISVNTLA